MTTPTGPGITTPATTATYVGTESGLAGGGQNLTPYQNVYAPAGIGGDVWGANGGGQTAIAGPLPALANASRGVRQVSSIYDAKNNLTVQGGMSCATVNTNTPDQTYADDSTQQVWTADLESPGVAASQL
jgi:hypothetical protein